MILALRCSSENGMLACLQETSDGEVSLPADWDLAANKFIRDMVAALSQMVDNVYNHSKASVLLAFIGTTFHEAALLRRIEVRRINQMVGGCKFITFSQP